MVVKNIVNIQNNKIDFDINGTNSLKYSFRGTEHFRLTEVDGTSHVQFIAHNAQKTSLFTEQASGTNADFVGRISNINNHSIGNLKDVIITDPASSNGHVLMYDGTNWLNRSVNTIGASLVFAGDDVNTTDSIDVGEQTFRIIGTTNEIETSLDASSTSIKIGLPTSVIISNELRVGDVNTGAALITTSTNNEAIFRNNIATANSGITLGSNGNVIIGSENLESIQFNIDGVAVGNFETDGSNSALVIQGTNIRLGNNKGSSDNVLLSHAGDSVLYYVKNNETGLYNENKINIIIGTSPILVVDATNSAFATDIYVVNKDSQGTLIDQRGGQFHSDGTSFYIAYNDGPNVTNFATDYALKLLANNSTIINAPSGGNVELSINNDTKVLVNDSGNVFIREQLNIGDVGGTSATINLSVSGDGANRKIALEDVYGSNEFIIVQDNRIRINHPNRISLRVADKNSFVLGSNSIKIEDGISLTQQDADGNIYFESGTSQFIVHKTSQFLDDVEIDGGLYVDGSTGLYVAGDTTIMGNLIVNGTQTILNTEIKLIEDPLIELGFTSNSLTTVQDIGFFGQYKTDNYAGLYYDVSSTAFRVFDSLGTNDYLTSLATNPGGNVVTTNARAANIEAKNFITKNGDFGQVLYSIDLFNDVGGPSFIATNFLTELQTVYGSSNGLYCGKSIFMVYKDDLSASSSILLNYIYHSAGANKILKTAVELETKAGDIDYISFDSETNDVSADITLNPTGSYKFVIRLLPILTETV